MKNDCTQNILHAITWRLLSIHDGKPGCGGGVGSDSQLRPPAGGVGPQWAHSRPDVHLSAAKVPVALGGIPSLRCTRRRGSVRRRARGAKGATGMQLFCLCLCTKKGLSYLDGPPALNSLEASHIVLIVTKMTRLPPSPTTTPPNPPPSPRSLCSHTLSFLLPPSPFSSK